MADHGPARMSSQIYDNRSEDDAPLTSNAAPTAGTSAAEGAPKQETDGTNADQPQEQQPKKKWYKRRAFIISQLIIIPLGIALLFILLYPIVTAIAQLVVNRSTLAVEVASISNPSNDSFTLGLGGYVAHTGIIPARIEFTKPIDIAWVDDDGSEVPIGQMSLDTLHASHKRATINQTTSFTIKDTDAFGRFAQHMITQPQFTWRMHSDDLHVQAAKFPVSKGIKFQKDVTLKGFNSFKGNVVLKDLQLPSDHPGGGIDFSATTTLNNPSPFQLNLGTVVFGLSYKSVFLGNGAGENTIIKPGENDITLKGYLQAQQGDDNLAKTSELFTNYINGVSSPVIAAGQSTLQNDGTVIGWLSQGLQALQLEVPFKPLDGPINPIRAISIGDFALAFNDSAPWAPSANTRTVQATMELPFGFNIEVDQIQNFLNISKDGHAAAGLSTPLGASTSHVTVNNATSTTGQINIVIENTNLDCPDPQHDYFSSFNKELTDGSTVNFEMIGRSRAIAKTSLGDITLDPINVNVTTSLNGLQGLKDLASISSVDVTGGTKEGITLAIDLGIKNPSNLNLSVGDLTLQLFRDQGLLGTGTMANLTLLEGSNNVTANSIFDANATPEGLQTLNEFVGKKDVQISTAGYDGSTKINSLLEAFKSLKLDLNLPGLKTDLLGSASLTILPTTGTENNISHVTVALNNPFSADLQITKISSNIAYKSIPLGTIESSDSFKATAKANTDSPQLDLDMNFDPAALFTVTRALAQEAGEDVAPLDGIVQLGGYEYLQISDDDDNNSQSRKAKRQADLYRGFNLPNFVQSAFSKLQSDVELTTDVTIGEYATTLQYSQNGLPTKTDDSLNYILPVLAKPIVQKIVSGSGLGVDTVVITDPKEQSFGTKLKGSITDAGPFDAKITFNQGLTVSWSGKPLGKMNLDPVDVVGDVGATLDLSANFEVADVSHLTDFTKVLLTEESFDWDIAADNLTVSALGIEVSGISLPSKKVTLKGFNGLKGGVQITTFDLPSNDPNGGIHLTLNAATTNPSQVGIELSSIGFETYASGIMVAPVASTGGVALNPGSTTDLALEGRLVPQDSQDGLDVVSNMFNNFVHGKDTDLVVHGASAGDGSVSWLNEGIKVLQIDTVLPNRGKLEVIKSIALNEMTLMFTEDTAYSPSSSSSSTDAAFQLPFAFPLDITAVEQTITVSYDGTGVAQLAIPKGPSKTDVEQRIIHLTFSDIPFQVYDDKHGEFETFLAATTTGGHTDLGLSGTANTEAQTAVGLLSLTDIDFNVGSSIEGLQGLNVKPVTVSDLDVNHGYPDYLLIKVNSHIFNPSNLTIGTGDVAFGLQYQGATIGSANIYDTVIKPDNQTYPTDVHYSPQGDAVSAGRQLLENYLQGVDVDTVIAGNTDSTDIQSLKTAPSQINLSPVTIPALHETLIKSASLKFPLDIVQKGVADASFTLANPFTASINLLRVGADASYHNTSLGKIDDVDVSSNPIHADGHSEVTSQTLPMNFNLNPVDIVNFIKTAAAEQNVDLGPLTSGDFGGLFQFILDNPDYHPPVNTSVDTQGTDCSSGHQFDVEGALLAALKNLKVDLAVDTGVKLDDFATDLSFNQIGVPAITDETSLYLIGAVAGPVSQALVDNSKLVFSSANITNISNDGFDLDLQGSLTDIGPLDVLITFVEPIDVTWQGKQIANIELPPVCGAANDGVPDYRASGHLTITDQGAFTEFATYLLHNPSFDWDISTSKLRLNALGTIFDNVSLKKTVSFKAFNNLPGVTISNFQLPSDDPAGGIHIETDSMIPSPAQLGIDLGTVGFNAYFEDVLVGPLTGEHLALAPESTITSHLTGRIVPQEGDALNAIGKLFSGYLAAENQTLSVKGDSVQPDGADGPVNWLSDAFKTLTLDVILPGQKFEIIQSIQLNDLAVTITEQDQAYSPPSSSNSTLAKYKNPFGFSLQVVESSQEITLTYNGADAAQLSLPMTQVDAGVSTGNVADLQLSWKDQPLKSTNDGAFNSIFATVTGQKSLNVGLKGTADVSARTTVGDVPISGIPFDVDSSLSGINSFNGGAQLSDVKVTGSGDGGQYVTADLTTVLENPSNVSLSTVDIALPVIYKDTRIGRAAIDPFDLVPGDNTVKTEFRYMPDDANNTIAQEFLTTFITTDDDLALEIQGDDDSTPFGSLKDALSSVKLSTSLKGLNHPDLVKHVNVYITLDTLVTNYVSVDFDLYNPLDATMTVKFVQSDASVEGEIYAHFDQSYDSFVVPPGQTVNSGKFPNVLLVKGALASLGIIPLGYLDLANAVTVEIEGGYEIPWLHLNQPNVPTNYDLALSISEMKATAAALSESSVSRTASTQSSSASASASESKSQDASTTSTGDAPSSTKDDQTTSASQADDKPSSSEGEESKPTSTGTDKPSDSDSKGDD